MLTIGGILVAGILILFVGENWIASGRGGSGGFFAVDAAAAAAKKQEASKGYYMTLDAPRLDAATMKRLKDYVAKNPNAARAIANAMFVRLFVFPPTFFVCLFIYLCENHERRLFAL